jgi:hypothetical protein
VAVVVAPVVMLAVGVPVVRPVDLVVDRRMMVSSQKRPAMVAPRPGMPVVSYLVPVVSFLDGLVQGVSFLDGIVQGVSFLDGIVQGVSWLDGLG